MISANATTPRIRAIRRESAADFLSMAAQRNDPGSEPLPGPNRRVRFIGQAICALVLRAPWAWPVIRGAVTRYFDGLAGDWDERTGAGGSDHLAALARATLEVRPAPERILDIGAGTGAGSLFLAREFPSARVRGVDISEAMISRARDKVGLDPEGRIAFRVADAAGLPYEDDSFDLIAQTNVPVFLPELTRVLRHDGYLIVSSSQGERTPFHTDLAQLSRALERRGFKLVSQGRVAAGTYLVARRSDGPAE